MHNYFRAPARSGSIRRKSEYPYWGILAAMGLIYMTPFFAFASYAAFAICIFRLLRYDSRTFAVDYCMLAPLSTLFRTTSGMALIVYLYLLAAVWFLIRGKLQVNATTVTFILLLNYLVARMQMNISRFLLFVGPLALLCVILPQQNSDSATRASRGFYSSVLVSSVYALLLRNVWQLRALAGRESEALINSGIRRFHALIGDPNYYMTMLVTCLALLAILKNTGKIRTSEFTLVSLAMILFGILTYSKAFFLALILFVLLFILWQFWRKKFASGILLLSIATLCGIWVLFSDTSPFAVVLARLFSGSSLSDITTGRTDTYLLYWQAITRSPAAFFFGQGFAGIGLTKDPHNLYLELLYYVGFWGLLLFATFYAALFISTRRMVSTEKVKLSMYLVLLMVLFLHLSLHGMFLAFSHINFFLAFISILISSDTQQTHTISLTSAKEDFSNEQP